MHCRLYGQGKDKIHKSAVKAWGKRGVVYESDMGSEGKARCEDGFSFRRTGFGDNETKVLMI